MKLKKIEKLQPKKFKRRFGVTKETYNLLLEIVKKEQKNQDLQKKHRTSTVHCTKILKLPVS